MAEKCVHMCVYCAAPLEPRHEAPKVPKKPKEAK
jgi:hypothetical protein